VTAEYDWFYWALLSAVFAALTAIFAKIGLEGIDSDLATLVRTFVIIITLAGFVYFTGKWSNPFALQSKTCVLRSALTSVSLLHSAQYSHHA
jgi:transporter family protein